MTADHGTITTPDGTELYTRHWATENATATILLLHGGGEHSGRYGHVAEFFNGRGYDVVAFDLRGHGNSGGPEMDVEQWSDYVDDLQHMVETEGLSSGGLWALYGHSVGGLISLLYLKDAERPQPDAAVLSSPSLDNNAALWQRLAAESVGRFLPTIRLNSGLKGEQLSKDPAVAEAYLSDPLNNHNWTTRFGRLLIAEHARAYEDIDRISVPTLVVHGTDDEIAPTECSAPLAAVDGVERKLYAGVRHEPHNDLEWEDVLTDIADWLDATLADQSATS
jgi:alpha-beta hydrolase superfamily lysophospholipase